MHECDLEELALKVWSKVVEAEALHPEDPARSDAVDRIFQVFQDAGFKVAWARNTD